MKTKPRYSAEAARRRLDESVQEVVDSAHQQAMPGDNLLLAYYQAQVARPQTRRHIHHCLLSPQLPGFTRRGLIRSLTQELIS